jgi:hypothetical protein
MIKSERLTIKVTPEMKEVMERMAKSDGESVASLVRRVIREEMKRRDLSYDPALVKKTIELLEGR